MEIGEETEMNLVRISRWDDHSIIVEGEYVSIKECIEKNRYVGYYRACLDTLNLSGGDFHDMNFHESTFRLSILDGCNFKNCNLHGADMTLCSMKNINLHCAICHNTIFKDCNVFNCNAHNAIFHDANLTDANFENSVLHDATFHRSIVTNTNFNGCDTRGTDFREVRGTMNFKYLEEYQQ